MFLLSAEDGAGTVHLERPAEKAIAGTPVTYRLETWLYVGGYKTVKGYIEGEPTFLNGLLPAAEVYLATEAGDVIQIELTDVAGNQANFRLPIGTSLS
jgi:hypothetical protein